MVPKEIQTDVPRIQPEVQRTTPRTFAGAATHSQSIATDQSRCRHPSRQPQCITTQRVRSKIIMAKNRGRHQERAKDLRKRCRRQKLLTVRGISKLVLSKRAREHWRCVFPIKHIVSRVCVPTRDTHTWVQCLVASSKRPVPGERELQRHSKDKPARGTTHLSNSQDRV